MSEFKYDFLSGEELSPQEKEDLENMLKEREEFDFNPYQKRVLALTVTELENRLVELESRAGILHKMTPEGIYPPLPNPPPKKRHDCTDRCNGYMCEENDKGYLNFYLYYPTKSNPLRVDFCPICGKAATDLLHISSENSTRI